MIHNTSQFILWIYNLQFCHNMWHVKIRAVSWSLQRKPFLPSPCGPWSAPLVTVRKYRSLLARTLERHAASQRRPLGGSANSDELRGEDYFRRVLDSLPMNRSLGKKFRNKSGIALLGYLDVLFIFLEEPSLVALFSYKVIKLTRYGAVPYFVLQYFSCNKIRYPMGTGILL